MELTFEETVRAARVKAIRSAAYQVAMGFVGAVYAHADPHKMRNNKEIEGHCLVQLPPGSVQRSFRQLVWLRYRKGRIVPDAVPDTTDKSPQIVIVRHQRGLKDTGMLLDRFEQEVVERHEKNVLLTNLEASTDELKHFHLKIAVPRAGEKDVYDIFMTDCATLTISLVALADSHRKSR